MIAARTTSPDETRALGQALAALLAPGDTVLLAGDLGAGKTTLVQGIAAGLAVDEPVTSPTFTIVHTYAGRIPVAHVDVYRLGRLQEVHDLGLEDVADGGVALVEWGEAAAPAVPADHLVIRLRFAGPGDTGVGDGAVGEHSDGVRLVEVEPRGPSWHARRARLHAAVGGYGREVRDGGRPGDEGQD